MGSSFSKILSGKKTDQVRVVVVGLDGVGKTTILYKLKLGRILPTTPTIVENIETLEYNNIHFNVIDLTGQCRYKIRPMWKVYFYKIQGLIYVVDSTDRGRVDEARDELHAMLNTDELKDAMVLVFANKQDIPNAMNADEIIEKLELHSLSQPHWHIQSTSAFTGEGLYDGLDWLSNIALDKNLFYQG